MARNGNSNAQDQSVKDLEKRIEWFDEERRKVNRKLAELEQKIILQEREISGREQRIQDLERQLATANAQLSRIPKIDVQLAQFKDDIVEMIEQYDKRRIQSESEMDRLRRVEQEATSRELSNLRKEIGPITALKNDMELRISEESRLANLIGQQKTQLDSLRNRLDNWDNSFTFLEEKEKHNNKNIAELQTAVAEINKRWEHIYNRLDTLNSAVMRYDNTIQALNEKYEAIQESTKNWMEQIQIGEYERNQKLENWRRVLEEQSDTLERFSKEWIKFSDQYKEAKMAVQTLTQWQEEVEKQQREAAELLRVETGRMQSRWDDFKQENDKRWKNQQVDDEQRWATVNRHERELREQLSEMEDLLEKLEQEKDMLYRIQTAQADALKQFPRLWLEEVEKAIAQNPNRRRQPALVPVREEFD